MGSKGKKKQGKEKPEKGGVEVDVSVEEDRFEQIRNLGISVSGLKKEITELKKALKSKDKKADKIKGDLEKKMLGLLEQWYKKRVDFGIAFGEKGIDLMKEKGIDSSQMKQKIDSIKKKAKKGEFKDVLNELSETRVDLDNALSKFAEITLPESWLVTDKALDSYEGLRAPGSKMAVPRKYFKKIMIFLDKKDFDQSLVYSNLLYTTIQHEMGDEVSKDRFKAIKDEVRSLMDTMDEFRKFGIEPEGMQRELKRLQSIQEPSKISEAQTTINRLNKNISRAEKEYFRRKGNVDLLETQEIIEEYGQLLDMKDQKKTMDKLKKGQTRLSPRKFMEESSTLLGDVKEILFENFEGQVRERMTVLDESLDRVSSEEEKQRLTDIRVSISEALENHDISEAMEYLSLAESMIGQSQEEEQLVTVMDKYGSFLNDYETLLNEDIELEELSDEISEIERMFLSDEIVGPQIEDRVNNVEVKIKDRIVDVRKKDFDRQSASFLGLMGTLNLSSDRMERFQTRFNELETELAQIDDAVYREKMDDMKMEMDEEVSNYFRDNYDNWATEIQSSLEKHQTNGETIDPLQARLDEAGRLYRERNYLRSGDILQNLRTEIGTMENSLIMHDAEERIDSAEFIFEEASRSGVNVSAMEKELSRAKDLLNKGEAKSADELALKIEKDVKTLWMEKKKDLIREDIQGLREFIDESDGLGLDISDANSLISEAEKLFDEEKFDEVNEIMGKARDSVSSERNQYYSEGAMESIKQLKQDISSLTEMGVNTLETETLLIEAERLFMNEEYEKAYSMTLDIREQLTTSRENYMKERIPKNMDEVLKRVGKLEVMGLETKDVNNYMEIANRTMAEGDLFSTLENIEKAKEVSDELFRSHISLSIPEAIVDVKKQIEQTYDDGLELDGIRSMLDEAEELFQNEDYDQAMSTVERAQDQFKMQKETFYRNQYQTNLDAVEGIMDSAVGLDREVDLSKDNINMARDAYERGDFEVSHKLMTRVMTFLEGALDHKEIDKRREIVQTYYDEVKTLLMVTEGENIDVTEEKKIFQFAGDLLTKGEFDQAEHVLEGIKVGLNEKRVGMKKNLIESSIKTSEILLQNLNDMGVDTDYERGLIEQLKDALRRGDLEACDRINLKLTEMLQRNQGPYMVQKVQKDLSELRARVVDAHAKGMDVTQVQQIMSQAIELFELGDIESSQERIEEANKMIRGMFKDHNIHHYTGLLSELNGSLTRLRNMGIPVDDEEELIRSSEELIRKDEIEEAVSWIETAQIGAGAKLNTFQSATAEGYITQIQTYLDELASKGMDIEDLLKIYNEGMELHSAGRDDKAVSKFSSILELGGELRTIHEMEEERDRLDRQSRRYNDLKSVGMKGSKKITALIKEIGQDLKDQNIDIEEIGFKINKLEKALEKKAQPHLQNLAKKRISEASKSYREIRENGLEDPSIPGKIKDAGERFRAGNFEKADSIATEIFDTIEALKKNETGQILMEEIDQVRQMLTRLKTLGSNVSHAESLLSRAEATLTDGRVDNADKLIRSVRQSIKDIVRRNMRETALETIEFVDAMIHYLKDNFSGIAQKIGPAESSLDEARELFSEKKFKAAKAKGEEARSQVEKLDLANIKQFLYVFRSMQGEEIQRDVHLRLEELKGRNMDISKARVLFNKAKGHFDSDEFDKGRQMITLARIMISELDQQSLRDKAFDELNNAHVEILTRKKNGSNVTQAYKTYNHAKDAFSLREYKKSILLSKRANYQARTAANKG